MKSKLTIVIQWWKSDDQSEPAEQFKEDLEVAGYERAFEMIKEDYVSGELLCTLTDEEGNDVDFRGSWAASVSDD